MSAPADISLSTEKVTNGLPQAIWRITGLCGVLMVLSLALYFGGSMYGDRLASVGQTSDPTPLDIIVGNDAFVVPTNMVRHGNQRASGEYERLDLQVHWPRQSGYTQKLAEDFRESDPAKIELVMLTFSQRRNILDMAERFLPVYQNAIVAQNERKILSELSVAPLKAEFGFVNEKLVYGGMDANGQPSFIARCQATAPEDMRLLLPCETDIFFGHSSVARVRFPLAQLSRWQAFSAELDRFAARIIQDG